ncbi:MAG: ATP-binding protein, partial [Arenimonas sp.]
IANFNKQPIWPIIGLGAALLAIAGIAGMWHAFRKRSAALLEVAEESGHAKKEMDALQEELATHRRLERELTEAKQAAEAAMMAKGEFLATMSHEIRTPLNGIIPMLDLLMSARLPPDQHDILRTAYTSARQMQRIVDDILDYSKLDANKLQLETTSFNLRDLLDSVTRLMEKPAEGKGLRLNLTIDPSVRLAVRGDPVRLRQVLTNLLSNALKFTERGSVSLSVTRKAETRTQHELRFDVKDTGIGISKAGAGNLFRPFSQADASTTRLYGGTGLGLVICKRIIDLMGGQIGVESEAGRGSNFWFEVPLLKAAGDIQGQRVDLNGARVLLLTNDAMLRQRLQQAAPGWGAQLTEADTTQDALGRLRSALGRGSNWAFDLLMVDLNSARSTAIALHRNLRRSPELEDLRVVYLLGNEPAATELNDGPGVLMVPRVIGSVELRTAIAGLMARPQAARPSEPTVSLPMMSNDPGVDLPGDAASVAASRPPAALRGRVLLVEDNPVNQMVAQRLIGMLGLTCETADNGEKALERMLQGNLDAVLMDCQLPVKDGYNASREWRQHEAAYKLIPLPIIAMTANAMAGDRQKCLDAGMDDYLSKPVDRRLLESTLAKWLQRSPLLLGQSAPGGAAAEPVASRLAPAPAVVAAPMPAPVAARPQASATATVLPVRPPSFPAAPSLLPPRPATVTPIAAAPPPPAIAAPPVLAMEVVEELRAVMGSEYISLIKLFLEDAPTHIQKLEAAAAANDIAAMVAPAHTLKSASANLGALALSAVAKRIELGARGEALNRPTVAVLMLENEFKRAQQALQALMKG